MARLLSRLIACIALLTVSTAVVRAADATPAPAPFRTPILVAPEDPVPTRAMSPLASPASGSPANAATAGAYDVIVWNRPLAQFRASLDFPDPQTRAAAAVERIKFLLEDRRIENIRVQFIELFGQPSARFYAGPHLAFALTAADLNPASGETLMAAADRTQKRLSLLVADHAEQKSLTRIIRSLAEALLALTLFAFFWLGVARLRAKAIAGIHTRLHGTGRGIRILGHDVGTLVFTVAEFGVGSCR